MFSKKQKGYDIMFMDYNSVMPEGSGGSCSAKSGCGDMGNIGWGLKNYPLAMVYSPLQNFVDLYDPDTALERGTLFTKLDLPFEGESVYKGGLCRG